MLSRPAQMGFYRIISHESAVDPRLADTISAILLLLSYYNFQPGVFQRGVYGNEGLAPRVDFASEGDRAF